LRARRGRRPDSAAGIRTAAGHRRAMFVCADNAVGNVDHRSNGSRPVWYFTNGAGADVVCSELFGDDC